jgi:hypothetical protein
MAIKDKVHDKINEINSGNVSYYLVQKRLLPYLLSTFPDRVRGYYEERI